MKRKFQQCIEMALVLDNAYKEDDIVNIWQFDQLWGSTALGFGGLGCSVMTVALTTVVLKTDGNVDVYFGTSKAYTKKMSEPLMNDIRNFRMVAVSDSDKYNLD